MSLARARHTDVLQRIMTSFSNFERKLDKLQDDVNIHGQTLADLRGLVNNLSVNTIASPDKRALQKHNAKKTTAMQYDNNPNSEESHKPKRKNAVQSLPNKFREKNYQGQKTISGNIRSYASNPRALNVKRSPRPRKAEAPRKATTLRPQKTLDKKRSKRIEA